MRLADLDPHWLKRTSNTSWWCDRTDSGALDITTADGILFDCPECYRFLGMTNIGCHAILCWQPHVSLDTSPGPGRWAFLGTSFADLTLRAGSSSVLLSGDRTRACMTCGRVGHAHDTVCRSCECHAHFFVQHGNIDFCGDSGQ